jgi:predicted hydrocarbon binding protein
MSHGGTSPGAEIDDLARLIRRAQEAMREYQGRLRRDPARARVSLADVPHALVPSRVMAHDLPLALADVAGHETASLVMYRLGYLIGETQAAAFFEDRGIQESDVLYRVLTGPFHLAWSGYGDVDILVWEPHLDERFAILWESENAASAQVAGGRKRACHLEAGYSAGWCTAAAGVPVAASELACRAEGVRRCRFLIAHGDRMRDASDDPRFHRPTADYPVTPTRMLEVGRRRTAPRPGAA